MSKINETVINFAVYENSTEFYGMAEVTLPEITNITQEIKGAGIAGTYESVIKGHIEAMSMTLNFRTMNKDVVKLMEIRDHQIDLRAAQQEKDTVSGSTKTVAIKHIMVVQPKKTNFGKIAQASPSDGSGEYAVTYWASYIDGKKMFEIDILNFIHIINGKDYLADVRKALGK